MNQSLYRELSGYTGINPRPKSTAQLLKSFKVFLSHKAAFAIMGCVMCSPLLEMWSFSSKQQRRNTCLELSLFPSSCLSQYQRVSGLHYVSSFSEAEDCCEDSPVSEDSDSEMT